MFYTWNKFCGQKIRSTEALTMHLCKLLLIETTFRQLICLIVDSLNLNSFFNFHYYSPFHI